MNHNTSVSFEFKKVPSLNYDKYFLRPLCESDLSQYKKNNSKSDFNKLMKLEEKKLEYNGKLNQYSILYEKYKIELNQIRHKRIVNKETINKLMNDVNNTNEKTIKKNLEKIIQIKQSENRQYYNLYKTIQSKFDKHTRNFNRGEYAVTYIENQLFDNNCIQKIGVDEEIKILKSVDKLPDELIQIVQTYLTFETRVKLLEHKIKNVINKEIDYFTLQNISSRIYSDYYTKMHVCPELKAQFKDFGIIFYSNTNTNVIFRGDVYVGSCALEGCSKQKRLFTQYLFLLLNQHNCYYWLYEIYRLILIGKNKLRCKKITYL